nr:hypothetical protein [Streptococcus pseudopneumoniae]
MFTLFPAPAWLASASFLTKSLAGIVAVFPGLSPVAGVVTVAFPFSSTTTVEPGLTSLTFSSIAFLVASSIPLAGSTNTLSAGLFTLFPAPAWLASASFLTKL